MEPWMPRCRPRPLPEPQGMRPRTKLLCQPEQLGPHDRIFLEEEECPLFNNSFVRDANGSEKN